MASRARAGDSETSPHTSSRDETDARESERGGGDAFVSTRARRDARRARGGDTRETVTRANDALETNDALDDARGDDDDGGERGVVDDEDEDDDEDDEEAEMTRRAGTRRQYRYS